MADKRISELPFLPQSGITSGDLVPLVTYFSAVTGDTVHILVGDLQNYILSGVSFSDIFVTGGTYNKSTGVETFTNNSGGTFTVTGITDFFITGGTYTSGTSTLDLFLNDGNTVSVTGLTTSNGTSGTSGTDGTSGTSGTNRNRWLKRYFRNKRNRWLKRYFRLIRN
jgi:hypothetical protein